MGAETSGAFASDQSGHTRPALISIRPTPVRLCCALANLSSMLTVSGVIADPRGLIRGLHPCKGDPSSPHEEQEQMCHTRFGA